MVQNQSCLSVSKTASIGQHDLLSVQLLTERVKPVIIRAATWSELQTAARR